MQEVQCRYNSSILVVPLKPEMHTPSHSPERRFCIKSAPRQCWMQRPLPAGASAVRCPGGRQRRRAQGDSPQSPAPRSHIQPGVSSCSLGGESHLDPLQNSTPCDQRIPAEPLREDWLGKAQPKFSSTSGKERKTRECAVARAPQGRRDPRSRI